MSICQRFPHWLNVLWLFYHVTQQGYLFSVERIKTSQINSLNPSQNIVPTCFPSCYNEFPKTFVKQGGSLCCLKIIAHKAQYRVDAEVKNVCNAYCKLLLTIALTNHTSCVWVSRCKVHRNDINNTEQHQHFIKDHGENIVTYHICCLYMAKCMR